MKKLPLIEAVTAFMALNHPNKKAMKKLPLIEAVTAFMALVYVLKE